MSLAKRLASEFSATLANARSMVCDIRGQNGDSRRDRATQPKESRAGAKPKMPPSSAEPWLPFELSWSKRVLILSDTHIPYHDEQSLESAVAWGKKQSPDAILLNGDIGDFYTISRWQKNPKKRDFKAELTAVRQFSEWLRYEFPKARIVWKKGNHDERWDHWLWNHAPEISDCEEMLLENWMQCDKWKIEMVGDQRPVMCGRLPVFHGHELGRSGIASPVNPARGAFLRTHHTVLVGHSHQTSGHADTNLWHEETFVWSTGCLCDLTPEYARVNRWNHGFARVDISEDGSFDVANLRIGRRGEVRGA
jgi:predicted phosphodiesterase